MKILFLGQSGAPSQGQARESRVEALAAGFSEMGHEVTVTCAQPYTSRNLRSYNGIGLKHVFSLDPEKPGGWMHSLLELVVLWRMQPQVVHMHGWRLAALAPVAAIVSPETAFVWTVDEIVSDSRLMRMVARRAAMLFDVVAVPTRALQYYLLHDFGVRAEYVPDGYIASDVPAVKLAHWGLKTGMYQVVTVSSAKELRRVARAYKQAGSRKKLVVMQDTKGAYKRLAREFAFLKFIGGQQGRSRRSIIEGAATVVLAESSPLLIDIYTAMQGRRAVMALTEGLYQETLGLSAQYFKQGDVEGLAAIWKSLATSKNRQVAWGTKAYRRARKYFTWEHVSEEYLSLYRQPYVRTVHVDSAVRPSFTRLPAKG